MSKIMSFAWTTPALLANRKGCTRRAWGGKHAGMYKTGDVVQAWDKLPRTRAGHHVAWIRLTENPHWEFLATMPDSDYEAEGYAFFEEHPELLPQKSGPMGTSWVAFNAWRSTNVGMWVIRFQLEEVLVWPEYMLDMSPPTGFMTEALTTTLFRSPSITPSSPA